LKPVSSAKRSRDFREECSCLASVSCNFSSVSSQCFWSGYFFLSCLNIFMNAWIVLYLEPQHPEIYVGAFSSLFAWVLYMKTCFNM
jgi:hypothetical protein